MTGPGRGWAGAALVVAALGACTAISGCAGGDATASTRSVEAGITGGGSSSSRAHYASLEEMTGDSALVLTGTAGAQRVISGGQGSAMTFTLTDLAVDEVVRESGGATAAAGSTVVVRQATTAPGWTSSEPEAPLQAGQRYLLFLSRGQGEQGVADFYPAGAVAGIYQAHDGAFTRAVPDSGDELPTTITAEQLRG